MAQIEVGLGLRDRLTGDLRRAGRGVNNFTRRTVARFRKIGQSIFSVKGLLVGLGTGIVIRGFTRLITSAAELDDRIGKLSGRLGVSTEFLSELRFAGEQSGVEFNQLAIGIQRAIRRIEEFRSTGRGSAAEAIRSLGLEDAVKRGEDFEEILPRLSDAFRNLGSDSERVRVAFKLFDSEGVALLQLFRQGSRAIADLRQEARDLGLTLSPRAARDAAVFNDEMNKLSKTFENAGRALVPFANRAITFLTRGTRISREFRSVLETIEELNEPTPEERRRRADILESNKQVADAFDAIRQEREDQLRAVRQRIGFFDRLGFIREGLQSLARGAVRGAARFPGLVEEAGQLLDTFRDESQAAKLAREMERLNSAGQGFRAALEDIQFRGRAFNVMRDGVNSLALSLESNFSNAIAGAVSGTVSLREAFRQAAVGILADLSRIISRMLIVRALGGIAGGLLGGGAGGAGAGAGSAITGGVQGAAGSGGLFDSPQLPPFQLSSIPAQGGFSGIFTGPGSGFRVPFTLHGREQVTVQPLGSTTRTTGPGGIVIQNMTVRVETRDAESFRRGDSQTYLEGIDAVSNAVAARLRIDPRFARDMAGGA